MPFITRRSFLEMAAVLGASVAWGNPFARPSQIQWYERRDLYPEGVASGDPFGVKETMSPGLINVISATSEDCLTTIIPAPHVSGLTTLLI